MRSTWLLNFGIVIVVVAQAWASHSEKQKCWPGFQTDELIFKVDRRKLHKGRVLGKVGFDDCVGRFALGSSDRHFKVAPDGTLKVVKETTLHGGQRHFSIFTLNSKEHKFRSTEVRVLFHGNGHHNHGNDHNRSLDHQHLQHDRHNPHHGANVDKTEGIHIPELVMHLHTSPGLRRQKRAWVIPPISVSENDRGPFPKPMVQIRSDADIELIITYEITGKGFDDGLFVINPKTGELSVTKPLDREEQDKYMLKAHADIPGYRGKAEDDMDIIVIVIDQNDNRPIFTEAQFVGEVAELSPKGYQVITIKATDADEAGSANADIRYRIVSQEPKLPSGNLFAIDSISGVISVDGDGLDREKYPRYTLEVEAADMEGDGLSVTGTVVLTVTDSNDNAPAFTMPTGIHIPELVMHLHTSPGLRRQKRAWVIPPISVSENDRGPFPKPMVQIRSDADIELIITYEITGKGFDDGLFVINPKTGELSVTKPLDREEQDKYMLKAHADIPGYRGKAEDDMDIIVIVIDQNDNRPIFTEAQFVGEVAELSPKGYQVITIKATDADEAGSANADIRYRIVSQEPKLPSGNLFAIDSISGVISVDGDGLDREKYPRYTLEVEAADMEGDGLSVTGTVVLTVTDSNDNAPAFTMPTGIHIPELVMHLHTSPGLRRQKRAWVIPPISVSENDRGPFPKPMVQIRSDADIELIITYEITGKGFDDGLFVINPKTGELSVTKPLDREEQDKYMLKAHADIPGYRGKAEDDMDIIVIVIDQNDNRPIFTEAQFVGEVAELSPKGYQVITIKATDADEAGSANADIRYRIVSQEPKLPSGNLFAIDSISGVISVDGDGLDREKYPRYTLEVEAADMEGDGLSVTGTVVLTVTDSNDNAPAFTMPTGIHIPELVMHLHTSPGLRRQKRAWVIPPISVSENDRGPFPKPMVQIRSDGDVELRITYEITGKGFDDGLFVINPKTGELSVTRPLDRERQDKYMLKAHADVTGIGQAEEAMDIFVIVIDQNDNRPIFTEAQFVGEVAELSPKGYKVITIKATDADQAGSANADIRYRIVSQEPKLPSGNLFAIDSISGVISVDGDGLDREKYPRYTLEVEAADMEGNGLSVTGTVVLTVTDSNDNAPAFTMPTYKATVPENKAGELVTKLSVTDGDDPHSPAWNAKFTIVGGNPGGLFSVETGPSKQEGIIKTVKGLDYEISSKYTLLVAVENDIPFARLLPTATATVVVSVEDVNEAPVFSPPIKVVTTKEDLPVGGTVVLYTATDPDTARSQKVSYKILKDPDGWLSVDKDTGLIKVKSAMDREGRYVKDNKYTALIAAYDNDVVPATGTGTLEITLEDVNDNIPSINERRIKVCNNEPAPQLLTVKDADGPDFSAPYTVSLQGMSANNWTAKMNDTRTGIILTLTMALPMGDYDVVLNVADSLGLAQDNVVQATVCDCKGPDVQSNHVMCKATRAAARDETNLKAADTDPLAPPYDSLLVFDDEGKGSDAGTLSSLNSSSSGDQDYDCLGEWGPRFKKLADMYGGGEDEML